MLKIVNESYEFDEIIQKYKDYEDIETAFRSNATVPKSGRVDTIYVEYGSSLEWEDPNHYWYLVGYAHGDPGYSSDILSANDILDCDVSSYMDGYYITDLEGMVQAYPEMFYINNTDLDEACTLQENDEPYLRYKVRLTPYKNMIKFDFIDEHFDTSDYCFCNEDGYVKTQYSGCTENFFNKIWNKDMKPNKAYDVFTDGPYGEVIGFREIPLSWFK